MFDLSAGELEPICTINENFLIGWERIDWAPDSRSVLVTLTLKMGVRVWRLRDRLPLLTLPAPKTGSGLCFSPCGRLLLILTRKCSQESILVLETKNYSVLKILSQPEAAILEDARFTPIPEVNSIQSNDYKIIMNTYSIIAWEGVAFSGRIFVFTGDTCRVVAFIRDEVEPLEAFGYEKFTEWSLCGRFAVLSSIPIAFSVYNALGMRIGRRISLIECCGSENTIIFREKSFFSASQAYEQSNGPLLGSGTSKSYIQHRGQLKAHYSNTKTQSRLLATFSSDSTLLAVSSSEIPNQVYIFRTENLLTSHFEPLVILIQSQSVRQITWHDISPLLCIVTSNYHTSRESQIYMWQQGEGAVAVKVPTGVQDLKNIEWATGADTLVVSSPKTFCLAVPNWASV